jgi:hypothetical protein
MHHVTEQTLVRDNGACKGTGGVSAGNRAHAFTRGFLDTETGAVYRSRDVHGQAAPIHLLDGLPDDVVEARNAAGRVARVKGSIVAGFLRAGCFYTRSEAAALGDTLPRPITLRRPTSPTSL